MRAIILPPLAPPLALALALPLPLTPTLALTRWLLRVGHVVALLLSFALSSLAALQQASGLLWMGYCPH